MDESVLKVVVDPSGAEQGAKRVESAISSMETKSGQSVARFEDKIQQTFDRLRSMGSSSFDKLSSIATTSFDKMRQGLSRFTSDLTSNSFTSFVSKFKSELGKAESAASASFSRIKAILSGNIQPKLDTSRPALFQGSQIQGQVVKFDKPSTSNSDGLFASVQSAIIKAQALVGKFYNDLNKRSSTAALLKSPYNALSFDSVASKIISSFDRIKSAARTVGSAVSGAFSRGFSTVGSIASSAMSGISSAVSTGLSGALGLVKGFGGALGKVLSAGSVALGSFGKGGGGDSSGGGFGGAILGGISLYALDSFIDKMVEVNNTFNAFNATLKAGGADSAGAAAEYQYLLALANNMGVEFSTLTKSYAKFTAAVAGSALEGKAAKEIFESIVTVSTVLHSKGYDTERMFYAITQSISKGRIYREELVQQLAEKLPGAMTLAAKSMGMSLKDLNKSLTDGTLDVSEFWLKFSQGLKEAYGPAAALAAEMAEANINRLRNAVTTMFTTVGQAGAMDGFINLVKALTNVINSSGGAMTYFGEVFGQAFQLLADWINSLSGQDIDALIKGVTGIFEGAILGVQVFIEAISGVGMSKATFLDFAEGVAQSLLLLSGILSSTINLFKLLIAYASRPVKPKDPFEGVSALKPLYEYATTDKSKADIDANVKKSQIKFRMDIKAYDAAVKNRDKTIENAWAGLSKSDQLISTNSDKITASFAKMRTSNATVSNKPFSAIPKPVVNVPKPLAKDELNKLLDNIKSDPNYGGGGKEKKAGGSKSDPNRDMMKAYFNEREAQIKALGQMENEKSNIMNNQNPILNRNLELMMDKIEQDERLVKLSPELKKNLLDGAKAMDIQAIALEHLKKQYENYQQTFQSIIAIQSKIDSIQGEGGIKQFTAADDAKRSTMFGGANQFASDAVKQSIIDSGIALDDFNVKLAQAQLGLDFSDRIRDLQFQNTLIGQSAADVEKLTAAYEIDKLVRKASIGLTDEQRLAYQKLGDELKNNLNKQLDTNRKLQQEAMTGVKQGMAEYLNEIQNVAKKTKDITVNSLNKLEDGIVNFVKTGKLSFGDLFSYIQDELTRLIVRQAIMAPLIQALRLNESGGLSGGSGGGGGNGGDLLDSFSGLFRGLLGGNSGGGALPDFVQANLGEEISGGSISGIGELFSGFDFSRITSMFGFAKGGAFDKGTQFFAKGGIVNSPTPFTFGNGQQGVSGEAGSEAILPLARNSRGDLGVQISEGAGSGGGTNVYMTVNAKDAGSFIQSKGQIITEYSAALSRARRNS